MPIYEIDSEKFRKLDDTSFAKAGFQERMGLQRLLRNQIEIISKDTLIIAEEFSQWDGSNRRIDLLGVDKNANLVVIELKRTETGDHMELQALRYAAMVSTMTFDRAVDVYSEHLEKDGRPLDATQSLLDFLDWEEADEELFAQDVRIVLASAGFSKEITTSVLWLNERGLDIRCIRIKPYRDGEKTLTDIQQVIPLPEASDHTIRIAEKKLRERVSRKSRRDYTQYDIRVNGQTYGNLHKRWAVFHVVRNLIESAVSPERINEIVPVKKSTLFRSAEGELDSEELEAALSLAADQDGPSYDPSRYFRGDERLLFFGQRTYVLNNQWGSQFERVIKELSKAFPEYQIRCTPSAVDPE
ncbi:hypothetical protein Mal64_38350 [Pseudobythopirellula maris]|uniref:Endonuclease NucS n=1 Tax=Pseudobythopirellula maris TaxID=2527991 RepID=A0A5C5ZGQ5_9BACT|nr:endonuclease NucS [Pseudobythopirellula maris]TWT86295.1 hypothetical protein Mal64_38350 [Pseudobythopirellula maris]